MSIFLFLLHGNCHNANGDVTAIRSMVTLLPYLNSRGPNIIQQTTIKISHIQLDVYFHIQSSIFNNICRPTSIFSNIQNQCYYGTHSTII